MNLDSHAHIETAFQKARILLPNVTLTSGMDSYVKSLAKGSSMSATSELVRLVRFTTAILKKMPIRQRVGDGTSTQAEKNSRL